MLGPFLIVICSVLWATDALFRVPLVQSLDAATIVFVEHVICLAATFPAYFFRRHETQNLKLGGWMGIAFIGLLGSAGGTFFFTQSYLYLNPSVAILLQKLQPIFTVIGARLFLKEKPKLSFYGWCLIAVVGSALVSLPDFRHTQDVVKGVPGLRMIPDDQKYGMAYALVAAFFWGSSTVVGKWLTGRISFPVTTFLRFSWGMTGISILSLFRLWNTNAPFANLLVYFYTDLRALRAMLYIALVPGAISMYLYYAGLKRTKASYAAFLEMLFPVSAVAINWRFLKQPLTMTQVLGMVVLLTAVFFVNNGIASVAKKA
jgi:drug/metabolite transporter (DMT)-like permease